MSKKIIPIILILLFSTLIVYSQKNSEKKSAIPGSPELPLTYKGQGIIDPTAPDGHLMYSPGVQSIQISRANRKHPPDFPNDPENHLGWTYQHHIGLGCWKGELYAVWDMTHKGEDNPPTRLVFSTSSDGFHWSEPKYLFPPKKAYNLRFYFYHASNGRMLAFGAGWYPTDNISESKKTTLVVREIRSDNTLGKVYTLINPGPTFPPYYKESKDTGFVAACREAYNNKPLLEQQDYGSLLGNRRMKWHEDKYWPGGHVPYIGGKLWVFGKAFSFFHRKDGTLVGVCKMGYVTLSKDGGNTWSLPVIPEGLVGGRGKLWGQKTPDGKYIMVYAPQLNHRWPMAITTSNDGITFRNMRIIQGEVPPQRYQGRAKDVGPQYIRGVAEWGGDAPSIDNSSVWVIYSMNKEDIWVSRIPVPVVSDVKKPVNDTFDNFRTGPRVPGWNTYSPIWAPVTIAKDQSGSNHYLQLQDMDPVDYARAIRVFPVSKDVNISFSIAASQVNRGRLEIELLGTQDQRPVRIVFDDKGNISATDAREPLLKSYAQGLTGTYFKNSDLTAPDNQVNEKLTNLNNNWGNKNGRDWSARWSGLLESPFTGKVTFYAVAKNGIRLNVKNETLINALSKDGKNSGTVFLTKGEKVPISIEYGVEGGSAELQLWWSWSGHNKQIVPAAAIMHEIASVYKPVILSSYKTGNWLNFNINANCEKGSYDIAINGRNLLKGAKFPQSASEIYAISFRTGKFRGKVQGETQVDLPNTEEPLPVVTYKIDNVKTGN